MLIDFREREREEKREGEKYWLVGPHMGPDWWWTHPGHVPWLGIKPMTFQLTGDVPTTKPHPPGLCVRHSLLLISMTTNSPFSSCLFLERGMETFHFSSFQWSEFPNFNSCLLPDSSTTPPGEKGAGSSMGESHWSTFYINHLLSWGAECLFFLFYQTSGRQTALVCQNQTYWQKHFPKADGRYARSQGLPWHSSQSISFS